MCTLYTYTNICMPRFSPSGLFGPSRCLIPTPGLTSKYPICAVCVCVCVYTQTHPHTHPHTHPPALKIEKTQTTSLSMKVSNNKPFVLIYKSHNTTSIPKQYITRMYSRGDVSPEAYRFWRLETALSVPATSLSRPTQLFVHSCVRQRLRANTSRRIKPCSSWYHPRRYCLQRFRTATARCACTLNAKSRAHQLLWILTNFFFNLRVFI